MVALSEDKIPRFGRYDIYECANCGEEEKCKSIGMMVSAPVDEDRDCCDRPKYEKVGEESAYTATQIVELMDEIHETHSSEVDMWGDLRQRLVDLADKGGIDR